MTVSDGTEPTSKRDIPDQVAGENDIDAEITVAQSDRRNEHDAAEAEARSEVEQGRLAAEARARERVGAARRRRRVEDVRTASVVVQARDDYARAMRKARAFERIVAGVRREIGNEVGSGVGSLSGLPRKLLRLQYNLAVLPLGLLDRQVVQRFHDRTPMPPAYRRLIGAVDAVAGALLGEGGVMDRGHRTHRQTGILTRAAALGDRATRVRADAAEQLCESLDEADRYTQAVRDAADAAVLVAENTAIEEKVRTDALAGDRMRRRKDRADRIADDRIRVVRGQPQAIHSDDIRE
ncbi:MAG TPA: hypothetical protein VIW24_28885 [Aldersonia sp.]